MKTTDEKTRQDPDEHPPEVLNAADGFGPLLQRDYRVVLEGSPCSPDDVVALVRTDFGRFCPENLIRFERPSGRTGPLEPEEQLDLYLKPVGLCPVRVARVDRHSVTFHTVEGHPEAGRITFGAYHDEEGRLVFRIRSRARASSRLGFIGYELFGKGIQTRVWVTFCERVAEACGGQRVGDVQVTTEEAEERLSDEGGLETPTFVAP